MNPSSMFCPNPACPMLGKQRQGNLVSHSQRERRYYCKSCQHTFTETKGTPFFRLRTGKDVVTLVVTLLAHGCPLPAIIVAFGFDERTVSRWWERSGTHCQRVH